MYTFYLETSDGITTFPHAIARTVHVEQRGIASARCWHVDHITGQVKNEYNIENGHHISNVEENDREHRREEAWTQLTLGI
jgi:hypothetical protein